MDLKYEKTGKTKDGDSSGGQTAVHLAQRPVFLTSNFHVEYLEFLMSNTLGPDWKTHFDLILANCNKPLFQRIHSPFQKYVPRSIEIPNDERTEAQKARQIGKFPLYTQAELAECVNQCQTLFQYAVLLEGNIGLLTEYFVQRMGRPDLAVAYFSAHRSQAAHATKQFGADLRAPDNDYCQQWDAICIKDEAEQGSPPAAEEAESAEGSDQPDEEEKGDESEEEPWETAKREKKAKKDKKA